MKRILITGADSYIGTSLDKWLLKKTDHYQVDTVDMIDPSWKEKNFSPYDVVFHVAGFVHVKETKQNRALYFKVNRDLAFETAKKAKAEGVKHFIFLSSMSVYGLEKGVIRESTIPKPKTSYGKSKYEAEGLLNGLREDSFAVSILRPPMVYGRGCKGNYSRLSRLVLKLPIFPNINNQRSMIYIDNLLEFIRLLIDESCDGLFFPQNTAYVSTAEMAVLIAEAHNKKIVLTKIFNPLLKLMNVGIVNKVFGDLMYVMSLSEKRRDYRVSGFRESITNTERDREI